MLVRLCWQAFDAACAVVRQLPRKECLDALRLKEEALALDPMVAALNKAAGDLHDVASLTTAQDILQHLAECCETLTQALIAVSKDGASAPGTDDLLPLFAYAFLLANAWCPPCITAFMELHHSDELIGRAGYVLAVWCASMAKVEGVAKSLRSVAAVKQTLSSPSNPSS